MPHQCTGCGEVFEDGSKEMLSGCPSCGGNKFQFRPTGADFPDDPEPPAPADEEPVPDDGEGSVAETVGRATTRVRDFVSASDDPDPDATWPSEDRKAAATDPETDDGEIIDADARRADAAAGEDDAQSSARSGLATRADVRNVGEAGADTADGGSTAGTDASTDAGAASTPGTDTGRRDRPTADAGDRVVSEPAEADPDIGDLREQLNDQFESIKIVEPGEYELNLMELYDREEYIIALQENGRYVIQVPDQWIGNDLDDR
jgi:predicted  nucleic acid-binding Zn-ribbon protein